MIDIRQARSTDEIASARQIFKEYEQWLGLDLCFQGFEAELANLPGQYDLPSGRLLLAYVKNNLAGCIGLRHLGENVCEMKRLYVKEAFRGEGVGNALIKSVIDAARGQGYVLMRLDTYPLTMSKAVSLYESHGFHLIDPYYDNPQHGVLFMELEL